MINFTLVFQYFYWFIISKIMSYVYVTKYWLYNRYFIESPTNFSSWNFVSYLVLVIDNVYTSNTK